MLENFVNDTLNLRKTNNIVLFPHYRYNLKQSLLSTKQSGCLRVMDIHVRLNQQRDF